MIDLTKDKDEIIYLGKRRHYLAREKRRNPLDQMYAKTPKRDIFGVRGEFAVCRGLGIEPEWTRKTCNGDPDKGHDFIWRGWKGEAKDTEHDKGHLLYNPKTCSFGQDIWALAISLEKSHSDKDEDFCCHMRIAGWVWRIDMPNLWEPCFFQPISKCIEQNQLNSFEEIFNIVLKSNQQDQRRERQPHENFF